MNKKPAKKAEENVVSFSLSLNNISLIGILILPLFFMIFNRNYNCLRNMFSFLITYVCRSTFTESLLQLLQKSEITDYIDR